MKNLADTGHFVRLGFGEEAFQESLKGSGTLRFWVHVQKNCNGEIMRQGFWNDGSELIIHVSSNPIVYRHCLFFEGEIRVMSRTQEITISQRG